MTTDEALSILIERNWFAKESYHIRKEQERLPCPDGATAAARHEVTNVADAAWKKAEAELRRHRIVHGAASSSHSLVH